MALLTRDFTGLILYEELEGGKQVSSPELSDSGGSELVSDRELVYGLRSYELTFEGSFEKKPPSGGKDGGKDAKAGK